MHAPVSVIIPTLNEEKALPRLLTSIAKQSVLPAEVIIADAFSIDATRTIARKFGCIVVDGGLPGKARNKGAKKATQELLLFLDADVILPTTFIEKTTKEFLQKGLDAASCYVKPLSKDKRIQLGGEVVNSYFYMMQNISPRACGYCIFATKKIHTMLHGFDESILIGEDTEYIQRTKKIGTFNFLLSQKIPVSIRRFSEEGKFRTICKYIAIELYTMFVGKVRKPVFKYEFGNHTKF